MSLAPRWAPVITWKLTYLSCQCLLALKRTVADSDTGVFSLVLAEGRFWPYLFNGISPVSRHQCRESLSHWWQELHFHKNCPDYILFGCAKVMPWAVLWSATNGSKAGFSLACLLYASKECRLVAWSLLRGGDSGSDCSVVSIIDILRGVTLHFVYWLAL